MAEASKGEAIHKNESVATGPKAELQFTMRRVGSHVLQIENLRLYLARTHAPSRQNASNRRNY